jgi:uncharacterized SAM-binding protein YcdF (DUF218 family)
MFFILSKILWFFASPLHLLLLGLILGLIYAPRKKFGRPLALASTIALALVALSPISALLLRPLEDRFPRQPQAMEPPKGIIVLGGAVDERIANTRGQTSLNDAAERMTEAVALSRLYPQAKLVFSGGTSALVHTEVREAQVARKLWSELGVPEDHMIFEDESRNTWENAEYTQMLVHPGHDERWLLITSAFHMPRAMGIFRALGMNPVAYPVDFRTYGTWEDLRPPGDSTLAIRNFDIALREWLGLVAYRLSGKSDALFPGP